MRSNSKQNSATGAASIWAACYAPAHHRGGRASARTKRLVTFVAIAAMCVLFLIIANSRPVLSQGVQIVRLDVAVVAKGYRVSKLIGTTVTNDKNEKIGSLDDVIIGRGDRALFGVLQVGGFLGLGARLVAVPYESLKIDDESRKIELPGASAEELKKLPEFKYRG
jgi:hypothetical protein